MNMAMKQRDDFAVRPNAGGPPHNSIDGELEVVVLDAGSETEAYRCSASC